MPAIVSSANKKGAARKSALPQAQTTAMKTRQAIKKAKEFATKADDPIANTHSKPESKNARAHFSKEEKEDENRSDEKRRTRNPTPKKPSSIQMSNVGDNTEGESIELSFGVDANADEKLKKLSRKKRISQDGSADGSIASNETTSQRGDTSIALRRGGESYTKKKEQRKSSGNKVGKGTSGRNDEEQGGVNSNVIQHPSKQDESFVSEVNAASTFHKTLPKASSPILQPKNGNSLASSKKISSEKKDTGKTHRGIVAEMYEHERRMARTNTAPSKDRDQSHNRNVSGHHDGSRSVSGHSVQNVAAMNAPTLPLAYGLPGIASSIAQNPPPAAEANLSPFGISPYAEPGTSWTTNVYVNNLPPHTSDDDLLRLGSCFGRVKSHKAIINQETGLCKGYGFIMYEFLHDAELAIQQLPLHGLATSWAKESFSSKLRRMADSTTSNVYLSNLPQDVTPDQLEQLFTPHEVISLRILTDSGSGKPRGVGFVRLRDRFAAESCIARLNGMMFPNQETPLQARFADSEAQKQFKLCARAQLSKSDESGEQSGEEGEKGSDDMANNTAKGTLSASTAPAFTAALKGNSGQHTWTGFATPASQAGNFSPLVGFMSPAFHSGFPSSLPSTYSPQVATGLPALYPPEAFIANLPYDSMNSFFGRVDQQVGANPIDHSLPQTLDWMSVAQQQQQQQNRVNQDLFTSPYFEMLSNPANSIPMHGAHNPALSTVQYQWAQKNRAANKVRPMPATYLPPDLAIQHARALMEKSTAQHAATAAMASTALQGMNGNSLGLTQQHVEHERAGLLKMLKEASENLARLRNEQSQNQSKMDSFERSTSDQSVRVSTENEEGTNDLFNLPNVSQKVHSGTEGVARASLRRSSNPQTYFGTSNSQNEHSGPPTSTPIGSMRTSVSANSLSPLRFLYSKDPKAPIQVEAIDLTNARESKTEGEQQIHDDDLAHERVPTPMPGMLKKATNDLHNEDKTENKENVFLEHPSTVLEEEKDNTTTGESDAQNSSYTSAATTTSTNDEDDLEEGQQKDDLNIISSDVLHKSDSGKVLDREKDSMVVKLVSSVSLPAPHGIMMIKNSTPCAPIGNGGVFERRNRSKSVVIHAPFGDVPVSPSQASVADEN